MTELIRFEDNNHVAAWALLRMSDGHPCWVGYDKTGIRVKKSRIRLFGARLFEERDLIKVARIRQALNSSYPKDITPRGMRCPNLKSVVNAILHCDTLAKAQAILDEAQAMAEVDLVSTPGAETFDRAADSFG